MKKSRMAKVLDDGSTLITTTKNVIITDVTREAAKRAGLSLGDFLRLPKAQQKYKRDQVLLAERKRRRNEGKKI